MGNYQIFLLTVAILVLSSCGMTNDGAKNNPDTTASSAIDNNKEKDFYAIMSVEDNIKVGQPVEMKFTVYNDGDTAQSFCKWHTPFEPFISKYLDIKSESSNQVNYKGAMAKRIMPPPADSYITVASNDSISTSVNLLEGYDIAEPDKYTITYLGRNMSGLIVKDSVSFIIIN